MPNQTDSIQQFVALRGALVRERDALQSRLAEIQRVLGEQTPEAPRLGRPPGSTTTAAASPRRGRPPGSKNKSRPTAATAASRPKNEMNMREAITAVIRKKAAPIRDIVGGMTALGYTFKSSNPVNSVGAFLYGPEGKKSFMRNKDGFFTLRKGS